MERGAASGLIARKYKRAADTVVTLPRVGFGSSCLRPAASAAKVTSANNRFAAGKRLVSSESNAGPLHSTAANEDCNVLGDAANKRSTWKRSKLRSDTKNDDVAVQQDGSKSPLAGRAYLSGRHIGRYSQRQAQCGAVCRLQVLHDTVGRMCVELLVDLSRRSS